MSEAEIIENEMHGKLVGVVRDTAKAVTGGNCGFADSDVKMLGRLARRAVSAGLTYGFDSRTTLNLHQKRKEFAPESAGGAVLHLSWRSDGGLRVWSPTHPGLVLSHQHAETVMDAVLPVLAEMSFKPPDAGGSEASGDVTAGGLLSPLPARDTAVSYWRDGEWLAADGLARLKEAVGSIVSMCADSRDVFPDFQTSFEAVTEAVNELYGCIEDGVFSGPTHKGTVI